jgi:hypothetical protein
MVRQFEDRVAQAMSPVTVRKVITSLSGMLAALNEHRRARTTPLTNEEKRARVEVALKVDPERGDRAIAEQTEVSQPFVGKVRREITGKR